MRAKSSKQRCPALHTKIVVAKINAQKFLWIYFATSFLHQNFLRYNCLRHKYLCIYF